MSARIPTSPLAWPDTADYWAAANQDRLLLRRCLTTGKTFFPPRSHSPFTGSTEVDWVEACGLGTVYSFSVLPNAEPAYCIAYVTLDEGPTLLTNLLTDDFDALRIGQRVRLRFVASAEGQKVAMFVPE